MKVPAKKRLREMADRLWSRAVRNDWANRCAMCGNRTCEAHHLIPRGHAATRYELRNGIALCSQHHKFCKDRSPHQNAAGFIRWLEHEHPNLALWYFDNNNPSFFGTKNADYYCDVIRTLRQYVEPEEFDRIVGVRFARHLE